MAQSPKHVSSLALGASTISKHKGSVLGATTISIRPYMGDEGLTLGITTIFVHD